MPIGDIPMNLRRYGKLKKAEGAKAQMEADARGMYAEGIAPEVIARIQKTTVEAVQKMLEERTAIRTGRGQQQEVIGEDFYQEAHKPVNPIYVTMHHKYMFFSKGTNKALAYPSDVRILICEYTKEFIIQPVTEIAWPYLEEGMGQGATVIWHEEALLKKIQSMLPEGLKHNVKIYGKKVDDGVLFNCNDLGRLKGLRWDSWDYPIQIRRN